MYSYVSECTIMSLKLMQKSWINAIFFCEKWELFLILVFDSFAKNIGAKKNPIEAKTGQTPGAPRRVMDAINEIIKAITVPEIFVKWFTNSIRVSMSSVRIWCGAILFMIEDFNAFSYVAAISPVRNRIDVLKFIHVVMLARIFAAKRQAINALMWQTASNRP